MPPTCQHAATGALNGRSVTCLPPPKSWSARRDWKNASGLYGRSGWTDSLTCRAHAAWTATIELVAGYNIGIQLLLYFFGDTVRDWDMRVANIYKTSRNISSGGWHWHSCFQVHYVALLYWPYWRLVAWMKDEKTIDIIWKTFKSNVFSYWWQWKKFHTW